MFQEAELAQSHQLRKKENYTCLYEYDWQVTARLCLELALWQNHFPAATPSAKIDTQRDIDRDLDSRPHEATRASWKRLKDANDNESII